MTHARHVTDHAVIRYLELVYGFNVDFFRNRIDELTKAGIEEGATGVIADGAKFVIRDGRVISVIEKRRHSRDLRSNVARIDAVLQALEPTDPELAKLMIHRERT